MKKTAYGRGWAWDDLPEGYAAPVSALQFNENLIGLEITPGLKEGTFASIKMEPLTTYFTVESKVVTDTAEKPARIEIARSRIDDSAVVSGTIPPGTAAVARAVAVQYPVRYYLSAFKHILNEEGIDVSNCEIGETEDLVRNPHLRFGSTRPLRYRN